ncbi:ParB/RepB/Spo0J family partition protein [Vallitaleaceae bacterium 9-2]
MARKRGLGQGLSALITDDLEEEISSENKRNISKVKITLIEPNPNQPRNQFDEDGLHELAESIKRFGVLQPLVVTKKDKFYEIIAGERRWRAAKLAKLKEVPIIIKEFSEEEIVEVALIENIQRENLNPIEEAMAYRRLMDEHKLKQDEIAEKVSKSRSAIANSLRLLQLDERVGEMLVEEKLSTGHARALLAIKDPKQQYEIALQVFDNELNVRETERIIKKLLKPETEIKPKKKDFMDPIMASIEKNIEEILGTKVKIQNKKNKGKIEIEYFSNQELERIVELIEQISVE